ncbi:MAG: hypothetical protein HYX46_12980 [Betaproteobacteria bacterium]|nr:hypothetical protein [Betaproteobacteria bacterium]
MHAQVVAALIAGLVVGGLGTAGGSAHADDGSGAANAEPGGPIDEEQALEREHAQKLRRAREELESRRAEAARRLEAEQLRQREMVRLQGVVSGAARRESYLGHEVYWTQRERDSVPTDPADQSAAARRSTLDHQLYHYRNELDRTTTLRQGGTRNLNSLQGR